ncbi:serine/threonine-protein kinase/endoribonuclease IRE2-like [Paramacrobiotus metropolitanus]|uniref:serine/threonine-protein kinase/endoribonuclease IRE2-like n=1 Tax=Paramacrobiotus metropolitanus TaxID=2943436 RepID=UPI00244563B4|nr:serine/threonine-protein kinase/endoribonuclease IRE2-like [Paramacrobiotus metropolitanus]XP_055329423.1 serine/threonine-protein kinase/endoribonuclease IRE2-like [Paramacrobiotus metropolitanus]XP_055329424.1 serine/threonine-protein kinase/endoribonuclease IRE2-like [Paramacrobiotus metropolitanus]XP_055329425.1 serine/threonine-protein kinase/endoribonuclease IRE2-like [Paramacrobiotus metropolitanus]
MKAVNFLAVVILSFMISALTLASVREVMLVSDPAGRSVPAGYNILLVSTLDGLLHAVDRHEGKTLWTVREPPRLQVSSAQIGDKVFVTDPTDGGLYVIDAAKNIQKFPKSIPELVGESPQKTSDGILITGKKTATWMAIDPKSGLRYDYQPESLSTCPLPSDATVFIPRTEYVLTLLDSGRQHIWNVTYTHYGPSISTSPEVNTDVILSSSNSGDLIKLSTDRKAVSWNSKYNSPVVAIYSLNADGTIHQISHHVVVPPIMQSFLKDGVDKAVTLKYFVPELLKRRTQLAVVPNSLDRMLFIGQHGSSTVYCMPALFDRKMSKAQEAKPFLETVSEMIRQQEKEVLPIVSEMPVDAIENETNDHAVITTAVSIKPEPQCIATVVDENTIFQPSCLNTQPINSAPIPVMISPNFVGFHPFPFVKSRDDPEMFQGLPALPPVVPVPSSPLLPSLLHTDLAVYALISIVLVSLSVGVAGVVFVWKSRANMAVTTSSTGSVGSTGSQDRVLRFLGEHDFVVGKIHFDPTQLLGRGCDGTCVFKGQFDGRDVAVKRLLPDCFSFADREVALLKESDFHPNVIRYFATESDSQFRYIALELCQATLTDYVQERQTRFPHLMPRSILKQTMEGLSHLHKLNIVHRDIKPHNILLSYPSLDGHVRVLISDFGLCKKISQERMSFTKINSGTLGTQGWIAPEMLGQAQRVNRNVDIFSAGCVFYYCLTEGHHPFGENGFARQGNIVEGKWTMQHLSEAEQDGIIARHIISQMIHAQADKRPSADCVLLHPFFWDHGRHLSFLQDVSDRIEKEETTSPVVHNLEKNAGAVVRWNWRQHIGMELQDDLKKHRTYRGGSVRDLLRAIRNKKHHYRELSEPLRQSLGEIPDGFVEYFISRFPRLLLHTYLAVQICKEEAQLQGYYSGRMCWTGMDYPSDRPWRKMESNGDAITQPAEIVITRNFNNGLQPNGEGE